MSRTLISMLVSSKIPGKILAKNILMNAGLVNTSPANTVSRQTCRESCHHFSPPPPPPSLSHTSPSSLSSLASL